MPPGASAGEWVHKLAQEISELQGAFEITPPTSVVITTASATQLLIGGNKQRFGLLMWLASGSPLFVIPGGPSEVISGIAIATVGDKLYWDFKKHGILPTVPWYASTASNPPGSEVGLIEINLV